MGKNEVVSLARELFKIRIMSSREGFSQNDGTHKLKIEGITSYNHKVIEKWYREALDIAKIIVVIEEEYLINKKV